MKRSVFKPIGVLASSLLAGSIGLVSSIAPVRAEGSASLYPAGATGSRANIEWRVPADGLYGGILTRRSLFKVDRKSTRLYSSHLDLSRMPSSA